MATQAQLASPSERRLAYQPTVAHTIGEWASLILLAILLVDVAMSINAAGWAEGLYVLGYVVLGGLVIGWMVARSTWDSALATLYGMVVGTAWSLYLCSTLVPGNLGPQQSVYKVFERSLIWLEKAVSGAAVADNLVFIIQLTLLMWWMAYLAAWALFRQGHVWRAVIPTGVAALVNLYYGPPTLTFYFVLYLLVALLLVVRGNLARKEVEWQSNQVRYPSDIAIDFLRDGGLFAVVVIAIAFLVPTANTAGKLDALTAPLEEPWQNVQSEWNRLFSSLNYQPSANVAAFSRALTFGGPRNLGDTVLFDVYASTGRYWQATALDSYTGRGWLNTDRDSRSFEANEPIAIPDYSLRRELTQTFQMYTPNGSVLFAAPQVEKASLPLRADLSYVPNLSASSMSPPIPSTQNLPPSIETSILHTRQNLQEGQSYTVVSLLSDVDVRSLRNAGTVYPAFVTKRYLDLPNSVTQRTRDLAQQIVTKANATNQYDKAKAIETWLRTNIKYNEQIVGPPAGRDGVDYFLFDIKEGYCDYYASAFAVMARSVGVPARVVAGYARGERRDDLGLFRIRERDAHTWGQVYFPNYGWIEFEPTAAQPELSRPDTPEQAAAEIQSEPQPVPPPDMQPTAEPNDANSLKDAQYIPPGELTLLERLQGLPWIWIALLVLVVGGSFLVLRTRQLREARSPEFVGNVYLRMIAWASRLGIAGKPSWTPNENAQRLVAAIPQGRNEIELITDVYVRDQFSPQRMTQDEAASVNSAWNNLWPTLRRLYVSHGVPKAFASVRKRLHR